MIGSPVSTYPLHTFSRYYPFPHPSVNSTKERIMKSSILNSSRIGFYPAFYSILPFFCLFYFLFSGSENNSVLGGESLGQRGMPAALQIAVKLRASAAVTSMSSLNTRNLTPTAGVFIGPSLTKPSMALAKRLPLRPRFWASDEICQMARYPNP